MSVYDKLIALGISLPPLTPPVAAFVPYTLAGTLVFLSGTIARKNGKPWVGKLGREIDVAEGKEAARAVAIDLIAVLHHATGGNLDRVKQLVKLLVLVNSDPGFTEPHLVANGASELLNEVFGDKGPHARSALGMAQLPFGSCVEIEMIAELRDPPLGFSNVEPVGEGLEVLSVLGVERNAVSASGSGDE